MFSDQPFNQIGEKVFYTVTVDSQSERETCKLELLTGDFNDNNENELYNLFDNFCHLEVDGVYANNIDAAVETILKAIELDWDNPLPDDIDGLSISIERHESEPGFKHSGCDVCNSGGANVYECIGYNDASKINDGEFWEIDLCGDCLYEYHTGERPE